MPSPAKGLPFNTPLEIIYYIAGDRQGTILGQTSNISCKIRGANKCYYEKTHYTYKLLAHVMYTCTCLNILSLRRLPLLNKFCFRLYAGSVCCRQAGCMTSPTATTTRST